MSNKITYGTKSGIRPKIHHDSEWWDADANEIKEKHNANDDRITAAEENAVSMQSSISENALAIVSVEQGVYENSTAIGILQQSVSDNSGNIAANAQSITDILAYKEADRKFASVQLLGGTGS